MNKDKKHIDSLFQQGLNNFSVDPPEHIWNSIEKELEQTKKRNTISFLWRGAAAAAVFALLFTTFWLYTTNDNKPNIAVQSTIDKVDINSSTSPAMATHANLAEKKSNPANNNKKYLASVPPFKEPNQLCTKKIKIKNLNSKVYSYTSNDNLDSPKHLKGKSCALIPEDNPVDAQYAFVQNNANKDLLKDPNTDLLDDLFGDLEETKHKKIRNDISVGGLVSPTYAFRQTSASSANSENAITTVAGGLNVKVKASSKFEFETGISYSQVGQDFTNSSSSVYNSLVYDDDMEIIVNNLEGKYKNSLGSINESENDATVYSGSSATGISLKVASISSSTNIEQRLDYIEVPLIAKYKLIEKKINVAFLSGLSSNFLVGNNAYLVNDGGKSDLGGISGINTVSFSATVGFGFQTPLTKSIDLNIEPRVKYFLQSISESGTFKPYSFGVYTGISYKL